MREYINLSEDNPKSIKIKYVGFWYDFNPEEFFLTKILKKYYQVEFADDADYVFCSCFGYYEYLGEKAIRILFSGENYIPDFNLVDYAISVYPVEFLDRHFCFPGVVLSSYDFLLELNKKNRNYDKSIFANKTMFANMIAGHESEKNLRSTLFAALSRYKRVESAGTFMNNMPDGKSVKMRDGSKYALQRKCKFTLCGESIKHEGFITEKIFDALLNDTIPIYYGSSTISHIVNKNAYIDVSDFDNVDDLVKYIIELDSDDEKYLEKLRQPVFVEEGYVEKRVELLECFVRHIIDQPIESAYRRARQYVPQKIEKQLLMDKELREDYDNSNFNKLEWVIRVTWRQIRKTLKREINR